MNAGASPGIISLHVLCPSLQPPNRFTINNLPLSTTVADLKSHISQSVPNRPPPESQRLIYRGKPLLNDGAILGHILEPVDVSSSAPNTRWNRVNRLKY